MKDNFKLLNKSMSLFKIHLRSSLELKLGLPSAHCAILNIVHKFSFKYFSLSSISNNLSEVKLNETHFSSSNFS